MVLFSMLALPGVFKEIILKDQNFMAKRGRKRLELTVEECISVWGILVLQNAPEITVSINLPISCAFLSMFGPHWL